jgi:uncharacterized protein YndB with AHSA1/START domain
MALGALLAAGPAAAEVKSAEAAGFEVEAKAVVAATPAETYFMLGRIDEWWDKSHTYSGNSANLRLRLKVGGCLCERIPDGKGEIEHMRVIYTRPGVTLRLQGGLGPLQELGVAGVLTWSLKPVPGGTEEVQTYRVGGYVKGGADKLAPIVDMVMAAQLAGLQRRLAR